MHPFDYPLARRRTRSGISIEKPGPTVFGYRHYYHNIKPDHNSAIIIPNN